MRKSIAIDMDGVLADVETHLIDWYEAEYGVRLDKECFFGVSEDQAFPDREAVRRYLTTPGFFRTLPLIPGALDAVQELMLEYDVYIVSAAMEFPLSLFEKREWLQEHFPFISWKNIIFCGSKHVIHTDYLVDDHSKNLDTFTGKPIMFTAGHNINQHHHLRANNWAAVTSLLANGI